MISSRETDRDPICESTARTITEIGHQSGTRVVAEFVSKPQTLLLGKIGVDFGYGFCVYLPEVTPCHWTFVPAAHARGPVQ